MRTFLVIVLALGFSTAAAQTAPVTSAAELATTPPTPNASAKAHAAIIEVMTAKLQAPNMQKKGARLIYADVRGEMAATVRVDYIRSYQPLETVYFHLLQQNGEWVVVGHDKNPTVTL